MSKKSDEETVEVFYGINRKTFTVHTVNRTRGNMLSNPNDEAIQGNHYVMPGKKPEHEISIVWDLSDIIGFPVLFNVSNYAESQIAALHEKAAAMKEASKSKH